MFLLAGSIQPVNGAFFGLFSSKEPEPFTFRKFFEGDWELRRRTVILRGGAEEGGADASKADANDESDELFSGVEETASHDEDGASLPDAFYSLRSDNLTSALVGSYYEGDLEEKKNELKLRVIFDSELNSGSFLTASAGDGEASDAGDQEDFDDGEGKMDSLFGVHFKELMKGALVGTKVGHSVFMSEGPWHGDDSMYYHFIVTHQDRFVITVMPLNKDAMEGEVNSLTITGTKYFGPGAAEEPTFFQKYFPTMMIIGFMILRRVLSPTHEQRYAARQRQTGATSAGQKEMSKDNN